MEYSDTLRAKSLSCERKIKTLLNSDLKNICKSEGLPISGVKAILQDRIRQRISDAVTSGDSTRLNDLAQKILSAGPQSPSSFPPSYQSPQSSSYHMSSNSSSYGQSSPGARYGSQTGHGNRLYFRPSPFYEILEPLTNVMDLQAMHANKSTVSTALSLTAHATQRLNNDRTIRIMVYCTTDLCGTMPVHITFPSHVEIKVNGDAYQGNLRGVKKKPGTTRPADITDLVRKAENYRNQISFTYAGTDRRFYFLTNLVKKHDVEELVNRIKGGRRIARRTVIDEMLNRAKDPDIVATSAVMSLKCPLSYTRMVLPCRSTICNHNQCFDATSFLQLQEQATQWTCPVCNRQVAFEALAIDDYVLNILDSVPSSTEQVTINPDGTWEAGARSNDFKSPNTGSRKRPAEAVDCDDNYESKAINLDYYSTPQSLAKTSTANSREPSTAASAATTSSKRPAPIVIDLTESDDESETHQRPVKRQSTGSFASSLGQQTQYPSSINAATSPQSPTARGIAFQIPSHHHQTPSYTLASPAHTLFQSYGNWH